jgi:hypothetical protein
MWFVCVIYQSVRTDCSLPVLNKSRVRSHFIFLTEARAYVDEERSYRSRVPAHGHEDILQIMFDCVLFWQSPLHIPSTRQHGVMIAL